MARRAQQSAVARCPWCDASLPHRATECPHCQFPLTITAADGGGFRPPEPSGTSSTATSARAPGAPPSGGRYDPGRAGDLAHRVHRIRIVAWVLGLSMVLLLLAGIGAVVSTSSPGARSDREAMASLFTALRRATDDPGYRQEADVRPVAGDVASEQPTQISTFQAQGLWFGASRSASGRCHLLAARTSGGTPLGGTLGPDEPCTAARVRVRLEQTLVDEEAKPKP